MKLSDRARSAGYAHGLSRAPGRYGPAGRPTDGGQLQLTFLSSSTIDGTAPEVLSKYNAEAGRASAPRGRRSYSEHVQTVRVPAFHDRGL
jgi:hypothetical protein